MFPERWYCIRNRSLCVESHPVLKIHKLHSMYTKGTAGYIQQPFCYLLPRFSSTLPIVFDLRTLANSSSNSTNTKYPLSKTLQSIKQAILNTLSYPLYLVSSSGRVRILSMHNYVTFPTRSKCHFFHKKKINRGNNGFWDNFPRTQFR